jgi:hypothetical protein
VSVNDCEYCDEIKTAFMKACDLLEKSTVSVLIYPLEKKYNIRFERPCSTLEEIEAALFDITGYGATLLIRRIHDFLQ